MAACNTELAEMAEKRGDSTKSAEFAAAAEKLYDGLIPNEGEFQAEAKKQRPNVAIRRAKAITARLISNATAAGTEADASERAKLLASVTADLTQLTKVAQASGSDTLKKFATAQYQAVADLGYKAETAGAIDNAEALYRTAGEAGKADLAWLTYSKRGKHAEAAAQFGEFIKAGTAPADMQKAYANCHTVLAKAAFAAGKYAEADTHLTALAKTTSDRAFGVHGLMVSGVQQEKWSQVIEHATAILKDPALKEKFGTTAQLNLVRAQNASGNIKAAFESAIKYRSELEEANQDSSLAKMLIAETYVAQGDKLLAGGKTEEARAMFVSATSETLYPDSEIAVEAKIKIAQTYAETDATKQQELLRDVAKAIPVYIELRQKAGGETARFAELLQQANTISNPKQ